MDFKWVFNNIKEKWVKIQKWFNDVTNFLTTLDYIKNWKHIALIWHDNIDGDSLGSTLALQEWLKNKFPEKKVTAYTNKKPSSIFDFLNPEIQYWEGLILAEDIDLIITLDAANLERFWDLYTNNKEKFEKTSLINIDHHISNTKFWTINIVNQVPATAQLVYEIISLFENKLTSLVSKKAFNEKVATYLLMWILTDTKNFTIPTTTSKTLKIAAELIEKWADKDNLIKNLFQSKSLEQLKLQALIIDRIKKIEENEIITYFSYIDTKDLEDLWLDPEDGWLREGLVNLLLEIKDANFVSLWRIKDEETSVSFRSKDEFDVNKLASKIWWGWHKNAAWAKVDEKLTQEDIEKKIKELIENTDKGKKNQDEDIDL